FKVPQVSVLFNFQGPVVAAGLPDSSFIISGQVLFVKHFFDIFFEFLFTGNSVPPAPQKCQSNGFSAVQRGK
ncbi:hypothetical protein, partial [Gemmiger sp.]|uniref:hypothetical protein n=1 Tax=Gemmiger sp. TaxID=2049027 RepID=UPI003F0EF30E